MSAHDVSRDFFRLRWASSLINLVCYSVDRFTTTPSRKASLQAWTTKEMKNLQCFSRLTIGTGHHKERAGWKSTGKRPRRQGKQEVRDGSNLRLRGLCKRVKRLFTRPLLSGSVVGLPQGRKYLGTIVSRLAPKKADQLFPQRSSGEANCNFSAY